VPGAAALHKTTRHLRALMVGHLRDEKSRRPTSCRTPAGPRPTSGSTTSAARWTRAGAQAQALATHPELPLAGRAAARQATRRRIQAAHVLVHASRMEGGAHVVIEAVAQRHAGAGLAHPGNLGLLGRTTRLLRPGVTTRPGALLERAATMPLCCRPCSAMCGPRRASTPPTNARRCCVCWLSCCSPLTGDAHERPEKPAEPRLTSLSHGGGCGCKIAPGVLSEILKGTAAMPIPKELLVGIETADDAAVYQLNDEQALIATTDFFMPIVDDPFDFGRIAATNAISDVYAMGGRPIMALALVGMPINVLSTATIGRVLEGGASVCRAAGIPIAGGHTIDSVEAIYGLVALGLVHPKRVKRNADARVGDVLVLGKPLGVGVMSAALKKGLLGDAGYAQMIASTTQAEHPGPDLAALPGVHALTDVTGFGLAGHALELARGANCQVQIDWPAVPLLAGVRALAGQGFVTGASGRNWAGYGADVRCPKALPPKTRPC
jgi:selenide,water dikinase